MHTASGFEICWHSFNRNLNKTQTHQLLLLLIMLIIQLVLTCPRAAWIGEGGASWSTALLSLGNSWLPSCCCCSLHCVSVFGRLRCEESLIVQQYTKRCSLSWIHIHWHLISIYYSHFDTTPCRFSLLSRGRCHLLLRLFSLSFLFLVLLRSLLVTRPLCYCGSRQCMRWGWHTGVIWRGFRDSGFFMDNFGLRLL